MKIFIITNIRSGGTAITSYFNNIGIPTIDDPQNNCKYELDSQNVVSYFIPYIDSLYKVYDCIKLSISSFQPIDYITIITHVAKVHNAKFIIIHRNNYNCALSILRSKKIKNGYKLSYDTSIETDISLFSIDENQIKYEGDKIENKYSKIFNSMTKNNIKFIIIHFEWLFDTEVSKSEKFDRYKVLFLYVGSIVNYSQFINLDYLYTESNAIYEKYCVNYNTIKNIINTWNGKKPFDNVTTYYYYS